MRVGMLWFDSNEQRDLEAKLQRAIAYYENKHGHRPTKCVIHPSMLHASKTSIGGVEVQISNTVLPHHFWLGNSEELDRAQAA